MQARLSRHMSKYHIVGNLMVQLIFEYFNFGILLISIPIHTTLKGKILIPSGIYCEYLMCCLHFIYSKEAVLSALYALL